MTPGFIIHPNPVVRWPVTVELPAAGGTLQKFQFLADVRVCSEAEYDELIPEPAAPVEGAREAPRKVQDLLAENAAILPLLIADWVGPAAPNGTPVPIAELSRLLTSPYGRALAVGLWRAVREVRYGLPAEEIPSASLGNSAPLPAAG